MPLYANIPAYDPAAATRILRLKEDFARADQVFAYALPEGRRNDQALHGLPNPHALGVYSGLRRAWLSGFPDLDSFKADLFPASGFHLIESPLEKKLRENLKTIFIKKQSVPYGQPTYGVQGPVFEGDDVQVGVFSFRPHYIKLHGKEPPNEWAFKTFHIVERTEDRLNICFVATRHNALPINIHYCADILVQRLHADPSYRGLPVQLFCYSPMDDFPYGYEMFTLIDIMKDGPYPSKTSLDRLPPTLDYIIYKNHYRISPDMKGPKINSEHMDFRGFALRTMLPSAKC